MACRFQRGQLKLLVTFLLGICAGLIGNHIYYIRYPLPVEFMDEDDVPETLLSGVTPPSLKYVETDDSSIAEKVTSKVRLLCYVLTSPTNHQKRAIHVKMTWGRRCDQLIFFSSAADTLLPTVVLNVSEGYTFLWEKTLSAINHLHRHNYNDADWFYKADDDTYAVIENLRFALLNFKPSDPVLIGNLFRPGDDLHDQHVNGGSGYVLSRAALRLLAEKGNDCFPNLREGYEDVLLSRCMRKVGGHLAHMLDEKGRERFFQARPENFVAPMGLQGTSREAFLYRLYDVPSKGLDCCSTTAISFHWLKPRTLYAMEYLIYYLRPFGIVPKFDVNL